eukprot:TRINITY_DN36358_c0_g1_i1.p1 TRINITY_DN36358_c0_g1~~TRINITY_DN36358_c0_g1_i1.p1  ORF type:complete len:258 (+),score=55.18 TRINITY_DN36358_c0_g1_i1:71-775(+)
MRGAPHLRPAALNLLLAPGACSAGPTISPAAASPLAATSPPSAADSSDSGLAPEFILGIIVAVMVAVCAAAYCMYRQCAGKGPREKRQREESLLPASPARTAAPAGGGAARGMPLAEFPSHTPSASCEYSNSTEAGMGGAELGGGGGWEAGSSEPDRGHPGVESRRMHVAASHMDAARMRISGVRNKAPWSAARPPRPPPSAWGLQAAHSTSTWQPDSAGGFEHVRRNSAGLWL